MRFKKGDPVILTNLKYEGRDSFDVADVVIFPSGAKLALFEPLFGPSNLVSASALDEIKPLREMTDWQLIETAPKDGKHFLGAKNLGVGHGWMQYICRYCDFNKSFGALFSLAEGGTWYPLNQKNTPSHWKPLEEHPND